MLFFCPGEDIVVEKISKVRASSTITLESLLHISENTNPRNLLPCSSTTRQLGRNINSNDVKVLINEDHTIKCQVQDAIGN